jgi:hypothetical protein
MKDEKPPVSPVPTPAQEPTPARQNAPAAGPPPGIPPEVLRQLQRAQSAAPMAPQQQIVIPHPAKCSLQEYLSARWEFVKAKLPMQMAEVLGINDPQVQAELSDIWARSYMTTRNAVLEGTVQETLRRSETFRIALEMAVMDEDERKKLIEQASKQVPAQFETLPE